MRLEIHALREQQVTVNNAPLRLANVALTGVHELICALLMSCTSEQEHRVVELFPRFTQESRLLRISTLLGPDKLLVECLRAEESLSSVFRFEVSLLSTDADISLRSLLGQPVLLELLTANTDMTWRPFFRALGKQDCLALLKRGITPR